MFQVKQLIELGKQYGTPLYVYSEDVIRSQYQRLSTALNGIPHQVCLAVKANSNLAILKIIAQLGGGFDVVSEGEFRRVVAAGGATSKVVFAGVGKTKNEIEYALARGLRMFNVESPSELRLIDKVAQAMGKVAPISFRINPDISVDLHPYIATGLKTSKFGMSVEEAFKVWEEFKSSKSLSLIGIDCHIGSNIAEIEPLKLAYTRVLEVAKEFDKRGAKIRYLDLGGGLGISYSGHYNPLNLEQWAEVVKNLVKGTKYQVVIEPGKFLVAEAGVLLTSVLYLKHNEDHHFAIVDAGMNDLIRPALYEAYHKIDVIAGDGRLLGNDTQEVDVVGPVCETGCFLAKKRALPILHEGDLLVLRDAGAYGFSMASNYNSRRLPAEVLICSDGSARVIRKRERFEEMWRNEA